MPLIPQALYRSTRNANMAKDKIPVTPAILMLKRHGVEFVLRPYRYEEKGGTRVSARELGIDEHIIIKTLVMEDEHKMPVIVLMHGDKAGFYEVPGEDTGR